MWKVLPYPVNAKGETHMNQPKSIFKSIFIVSLIFVCSTVLYSQQVEPSYDISLQLVIGSNETIKGTDLPTDLAGVSRQLRTAFTFSNYRLASTFFGRISNTGNFEYKSVSNIFGQESTAGSQSFLEWSVGNFRNMPTSKGQLGFQFQSFRFGAKIPVMTSSAKDEAGKMNLVINYEPIGLNLNKVGLPENTPILIGTLNLPGTSGTIFLIMTVRSTD